MEGCAVLAACLLMVVPTLARAQNTDAPEMQWPPVTRQMRPWTRWWWPGSAVDKPNLTRLLQTYHDAGLGGVEITPIYGVQGQEARDLPYLSPAWLDALHHTLAEAKRLDMGVDMPTGTGWPFGGPTVSEADALDKLTLKTVRVNGGATAVLPPGIKHPSALVAVSAQGISIPLLDKLDASGILHWAAPSGDDWTLYAASVRWSGMNVKRAAPGGAGRCINPFSQTSLTHYLSHFDAALADTEPGALRCQFHDSFEYQADWSPDMFDAFKARRGYDLGEHLPALASHGDPDEVARVRADYHETVSELLLENFTRTWTAWAHTHGSLSRNQAHGSPGNLLDLYGACDIPETEVFRSVGDIRISKFASSAAHVNRKPLVSAESCTWQSEHFTETLGQSKHIIDRLFAAGINHIFYHGTAYSPGDAAWPGWLFYASTHFEPNNPTWRDFPALNAYVTRCQSVLQSGQPDNDVLLYWPLSDLWHKHPTLFGLTIEGKWLESEPVGDTAQTLWNRGYAYDYISDKQLGQATVEAGKVRVKGGLYKTVLVPPCRYMPLDTLRTLLALAEAGATVVFQNGLPADVPGWNDLQKRRGTFQTLLAPVQWASPDARHADMRRARHGRGSLLAGPDLDALFAQAQTGIRRETLVDHAGLMFTRRAFPSGHHYFLVNQGDKPLDAWVALSAPGKSAVLLDPMTGRTGVAQTRRRGGDMETYLQLQPGEARIVRVLTQEHISGAAWQDWQPAGQATPLSGTWKVDFVAGGPALPTPFTTSALGTWTDGSEVELQRFAGTARYTLTFNAPIHRPEPLDAWTLDLGDVRDTARVVLNGQDTGTLLAAPFQIVIGAETLKPTGNVLEVYVTNVAANRIRDLDRRKVAWKIFREINFVNIDYKPFDASGWPVRPAGLLGPVRLLPMRHAHYDGQ